CPTYPFGCLTRRFKRSCWTASPYSPPLSLPGELNMRIQRLVLPCGLLALCLSVNVSRGGEWKPLTTELIANEKPGYGGLCGVAVERESGDLYLNVSDKG